MPAPIAIDSSASASMLHMRYATSSVRQLGSAYARSP